MASSGLVGLRAGLKKGDRKSIARCITLSEDDPVFFSKIVKGLYNPAMLPGVVGITGPPGVGKSSLLSLIAPKIRRNGHRLAIIAIDASSPFSSGAFLGNRIRMEEMLSKNGIFMRSIASRGAKGGLSTNLIGAIITLSCAGFDTVLVESVGAGQADVDILDVSSTTVLILAPGLGDTIQAMKAGIMEIPDLYVINKSDLSGANDAVKAVYDYLRTLDGETGKKVAMTSAIAKSGIDELVKSIENHEKSIDRKVFSARVFEKEIARIAKEIAAKRIDVASADGGALVKKMLGKKSDPYSAALELLDSLD